MALNRSPVAQLVPQMMERYRRGNIVKMLIYPPATDKDLGMGASGGAVETLIEPEPFVNAIKINAVVRSGGAFKYSDLMMTMARQSIKESDALDSHTEWEINGDRYETVALTPGPSAWEIVLRRQTTSPVTP